MFCKHCEKPVDTKNPYVSPTESTDFFCDAYCELEHNQRMMALKKESEDISKEWEPSDPTKGKPQ